MTPLAFVKPKSIFFGQVPVKPPLMDNLPATPTPPPAWFEALFWTGAWMVAHFVPAVGFAVLTLIAGANPDMDSYNHHLMLCGRVLALGLGIFLLKARVGPSWKSAIHLRRPRVVHCLLAVLCLPAVVFLSAGIMGLLAGDGDGPLPTSGSLPALWYALIVFAVAPAVNEEIFHRGFLGRLLLGRYGVVVGVLFTSAIFAIVHGNIPQIVLAFIFGIVAHAIYLATRSLWVPILMHFLVNACMQVLMRTEVLSQSFETTDVQVCIVGLVAIVATLTSLLAALGLYRLREREVVADLCA
ncbi:MAG TPA: CPBP family intramembrane glutamic endopeptidase [Gemmataceae bacterium]|nr:CPBP family intramembrane glutamic endopeptidase [Gemmataceae bacterium]